MPSAAILPFRIPDTKALAMTPSRGPAEIIIFPGVQYIRMHDDGDTFSLAISPPSRNTSTARPSSRPPGGH